MPNTCPLSKRILAYSYHTSTGKKRPHDVNFALCAPAERALVPINEAGPRYFADFGKKVILQQIFRDSRTQAAHFPVSVGRGFIPPRGVAVTAQCSGGVKTPPYNRISFNLYIKNAWSMTMHFWLEFLRSASLQRQAPEFSAATASRGKWLSFFAYFLCKESRCKEVGHSMPVTCQTPSVRVRDMTPVYCWGSSPSGPRRDGILIPALAVVAGIGLLQVHLLGPSPRWTARP